MINSKVAPNPKILPTKNKEAVLVKILDKQIKEQEYLSRIYAQQIDSLLKRKQQLENRFRNWESNGEGFRKTWQHQSLVNQSRLRNNATFIKNFSVDNHSVLNQSIYLADSPSKFAKKGSNQSPIRKLQSSNVKLDKKLGKSSSLSPQKYNKRQQLQKQTKQLWSRIVARDSKLAKNNKEDEICENLLKKIGEQEEEIYKQIMRWKELEVKQRCKKQIEQRSQRIKEEIFKQKQGIVVVKQQKLNRNKEIVRNRYTKKMLAIISAYGGVRKD